MKNTLILFLLFLQNTLFAQADVAKKLGFTTFFIGNKDEKIECIVADLDLSKPKPLAIFVQGSGAMPLFLFDTVKKDTTFMMPFDVKKYAQDVRFVFIHKRGIPTLGDIDGKYFDFEKMSLEFLEHEKLENRVKRIEKVVDFLSKQKWVDKKKIYLIGHSAGYRVTADVAAKSKKLAKVVCMSANPFSRNIQYVREQRLKMHRGEISDTLATNNLDTIFTQYASSLNYKFDESQAKYTAFYASDISYNKTFSIDNLLKINVPLLITYGSADIGALDNDMIPYFFIQKNKWNFEMKCYPNLEHNYLKLDKNGKILERHWQDVLDDVVKWLKS